MGEKIIIQTDKLENVGNEGDLEVWEMSIDRYKSDRLKTWEKSIPARVLGVNLTRKKMPLVEITIENKEEGE